MANKQRKVRLTSGVMQVEGKRVEFLEDALEEMKCAPRLSICQGGLILPDSGTGGEVLITVENGSLIVTPLT